MYVCTCTQYSYVDMKLNTYTEYKCPFIYTYALFTMLAYPLTHSWGWGMRV